MDARRRRRFVHSKGSVSSPESTGTKLRGAAAQNRKIGEYYLRRDWRGLLRYAEDKSSDFNHVNWATMFNKLGWMRGEAATIRADPAFGRVLREFEAKVEDEGLDWIGVRQLGTLVHGLAAMGVTSSVVFDKVATGVTSERICSTGNPQAIANTAWAFAKIGMKAPYFFAHAMSSRNVERLTKVGNAQAISNTLWAMARLGHSGPGICRAIEDREVASKIIASERSQNVASVLWALSKFHYECPVFVRCVCENIEEIAHRGSVQGLSNIAYAFADLGYFEDAIFDEVSKHADRVVEKGTMQAACNILWAYAISGKMKAHEETVKLLWDETMKRPLQDFTRYSWTTLEIARLFAKAEGISLVVEDKKKIDMITKACKHASYNEKDIFFDIVARDLRMFGYQGFVREVSPFKAEGGGDLLKIDLAWEKEMVAVELDGPSHFLTKPYTNQYRKRRDGPTVAKERLLRKIGWKYISFSYIRHRTMDFMSKKDRKIVWDTVLGGLDLPKKKPIYRSEASSYLKGFPLT